MQSYSELELTVGESILIGNQVLTLLDLEGELALFQLDANEEYQPIDSEELIEMLSADCSATLLPR